MKELLFFEAEMNEPCEMDIPTITTQTVTLLPKKRNCSLGGLYLSFIIGAITRIDDNATKGATKAIGYFTVESNETNANRQTPPQNAISDKMTNRRTKEEAKVLLQFEQNLPCFFMT